MKKIYIITLLIVFVYVSNAIAGNTIKVMRIYNNSGNISTIPLADIDSINHSKFDLDGNLKTDHVTSIIWAIDSMYKNPINEIDSVVFADIDIDEHNARIEKIHNQIFSQEGVDVTKFQTDLISWLSSQEWVNNVEINDNKDLITVSFSNGLNFYVDFQDENFFYVSGSGNGGFEIQNYVPYIENEEIIDNTNIMYIEGRAFRAHAGDDYFTSEYDQLKDICDKSPVNIKMPHDFSFNLSFLDEEASKYGITIISQTHGSRDGSFQVENENTSSLLNRALVYIKRGAVHYLGTEADDWVFGFKYTRIRPYQFANILKFNKNQIVYGNYCYSYGLSSHLKNCVLYGHINESCHENNVENLIQFITRMVSGYPYCSSINLTPYNKVETLTIPTTNNLYSRLRYFSISQNNIKTGENESIIISGKINGYKNLKSGLTPFVFIHEGEGSFTIDKIITGSTIEVKTDGTFVCKYNEELEIGQKYGFIIGFAYGENLYYGAPEYYTKQGPQLCPDENHPHMIDLGLPSGVKWSCCNVGSNTPEGYGGYYAWGETETDTIYDFSSYIFDKVDFYAYHLTKYCTYSAYGYQGYTDDKTCLEPQDDAAHVVMGGYWRMPTLDEYIELYDKCTWDVEHYNNVWGIKITGINGNSIFMPAAGSWNRNEPYGIDGIGYYWSSSLCNNPYYAYNLYFNVNGLANPDDTYIREIGCSVRAVCP